MLTNNDEPYTLADAFNTVFSKGNELKINQAFATKVKNFHVAYVHQSQDYMDFFGGNLIGVQRIHFTDIRDIPRFYRDVLGVDVAEVEAEFAKVNTIVKEYKISGDVFNQTLFYLIHRAYTSPHLTEDKRFRLAYDLGIIFFYRTIAALQSDYFEFVANPSTAKAAYARLTNRFIIKQCGSWAGVMDYRAKDLARKDDKVYPVLVLYTNDQDIVALINKFQGALRSMYKEYYAEFNKVHVSGSRIGTTSATMVDMEGVEKVREKVHSVEKYVSFIRTSIADPASFVRTDIVDVILGINTNSSNKTLTATLTWLSENYNNIKWHNLIDEYISLIIMHSFHLLENSGSAVIRDYPEMLTSLKNFYLSTRSSDAELQKIREVGEKLVMAANGKINRSLMMATRTSTILYITLRALAAPRV